MTPSILRLSDGRDLCWEEYGDRDGTPVFVFHGNPGSRLAWGAMPGTPFLDGIRLVAPDRPGYGRTEFKPRALERWPHDVLELSDHLAIDEFAIFAPSGGAPYALACAWKIPARLTSVGVFGAVGPNAHEAVEGLAMKLRDLELNDEDKAIFDRPEIIDLFRLDLPEAYRQNGIGSAYDATIPSSWPIPLEEITIRVQLWHAERDPLVGNMTRYLASRLPDAELKCLPGEGHLWILDHMPEVLATLVGRGRAMARDTMLSQTR